jgi:hypothetical protein
MRQESGDFCRIFCVWVRGLSLAGGREAGQISGHSHYQSRPRTRIQQNRPGLLDISRVLPAYATREYPAGR